MCDHVILDCVGELLGIFVIDAVDHSRLQQDIGVEFRRTKRSRAVRREERVAGSTAEYNYPALFKMADSLAENKRLSDLLHCNGSLNSDLAAELFKHIGYSKGVHGSGEHADMVCTRSVHTLGASSAPKISAADNYANLSAGVSALFYALADVFNGRDIKPAALISGKRFAAELQQYSLILRSS